MSCCTVPENVSVPFAFLLCKHGVHELPKRLKRKKRILTTMYAYLDIKQLHLLDKQVDFERNLSSSIQIAFLFGLLAKANSSGISSTVNAFHPGILYQFRMCTFFFTPQKLPKSALVQHKFSAEGKLRTGTGKAEIASTIDLA